MQCCTSPCCDFNNSAYSLVCRQRRKEVSSGYGFAAVLRRSSSFIISTVILLWFASWQTVSCLSVSVSFVLLQPEAAGQSVSSCPTADPERDSSTQVSALLFMAGAVRRSQLLLFRWKCVLLRFLSENQAASDLKKHTNASCQTLLCFLYGSDTLSRTKCAPHCIHFESNTFLQSV